MHKMLMPINNQTSIKNAVNLLINLITKRYYFFKNALTLQSLIVWIFHKLAYLCSLNRIQINNYYKSFQYPFN
jgi:hypothetical protein